MRGSCAELIMPKVVALFRFVPGLLKRVWLNALNISHRTLSLMFSRTGNEREIAISTFQVPGPRTKLRPAFPKVPAACLWNAAVLNHCESVWLELAALPTTFGRSRPRPVREMSVPSVTFRAAPVDLLKIGESCQLPAIHCSHFSLNFGVSVTPDALKICLRSAPQLAHSDRRSFGFW